MGEALQQEAGQMQSNLHHPSHPGDGGTPSGQEQDGIDIGI